MSLSLGFLNQKKDGSSSTCLTLLLLRIKGYNKESVWLTLNCSINLSCLFVFKNKFSSQQPPCLGFLSKNMRMQTPHAYRHGHCLQAGPHRSSGLLIQHLFKDYQTLLRLFKNILFIFLCYKERFSWAQRWEELRGNVCGVKQKGNKKALKKINK